MRNTFSVDESMVIKVGWTTGRAYSRLLLKSRLMIFRSLFRGEALFFSYSLIQTERCVHVVEHAKMVFDDVRNRLWL